MKKALSILLVFMLILTTIGPLPNVLAAETSINRIIDGVAQKGADNTYIGSITVNLNNPTTGETLQIFDYKGQRKGNQPIESGQNQITFPNLSPGIYTISIEGSSISQTGTVKPPALLLDEKPTGGKITVINAIPDAQLIIERADKPTFNPRKATVGKDGIGSFNIGYLPENVPPGKNYTVRQEINGAKSDASNAIDIQPEPVKVQVLTHSGKDNNQGSIRVTGSRGGNQLYLYDLSNASTYFRRGTAESNGEFIFNGLKAGNYYVIQEEEEAFSVQSDQVTIQDNVDPTLALNVPENLTVPLPANFKDYDYRNEINKETDIVATDNISLKKVDVDIQPSQQMNIPGKYTITYTAIDASNNSKSISRTVTLLPPTITIKATNNTCIELKPDADAFIDCINPNPWRNTGDIIVNNVMPNATLRVYQDPDKKLIQEIQETSEGEFSINDRIIVGLNYYVTQVVGGFESEPSTRTTIRDNTPPKLQLKGEKNVAFVRGSNYIEYGVNATDNLDNPNELTTKVVIDTSNVNMNVPGLYTVTYDVSDAAGNKAKRITRKVTVSPQPVIAIGSYADLGEVSVKNAFPGSVLKLYDVTNDKTPIAVSDPLPTGVTTHVFQFISATDSSGKIKYDSSTGKVINTTEKIPPGSYFVIQEFTVANQTEPLRSVRSNIVDVIDTNRPYITLDGSENLFFIWNEAKDDYTYDENIKKGKYHDPGAMANDYLDDPKELTKKIKKKILFGTVEKCIEKDGDDTVCPNPIEFEAPGIYKIFYNVTTQRGTKANEKIRTITVAPPKVEKIESQSGSSQIDVSGIFNDGVSTTILNLYNTYDQIIATRDMKKESNPDFTTFGEIPAGLGYYVTQTVNGIESAKSNPVNVSVHGEANKAALFTSFGFKNINSTAVIDHENGNITVTVPKGTKLETLIAEYTSTGNVTEPTEKHSYDKPLTYIVTSKDNKVNNMYKITVIEASQLSLAANSLNKKIANLNSNNQIITLTSVEKNTALEKGVTFLANDTAIYVPSGNVKETKNVTISVKKPSNDTIEVVWGSMTNTFVQPLEIEMPYTPNKKFAKKITRGETTYMAIQPNEREPKSKTSMIGLATESGSYSLVDQVSAPTITPVGDSFKLSTSETGAVIYYTTSSSNISFDRSARNGSFIPNAYTIDSSFDITQWKIANNNEKVPSTNGEIFAFVMKNNIISPISAKFNDTPVRWNQNMEPPTYPTTHILKIAFNAKVSRKALYSGHIYVVDNTTNEPVKTTLTLSDDGKTILVSPNNPYTSGRQYTLVIERQFKGATQNNEFLNQAITQTFNIK